MSTLVEQSELRDDLRSVVEARKELTADQEEQLVESFLKRVDQEIDVRIESRILAYNRVRKDSFPWSAAAVIIAAIALAVPIAGVSASYAGTFGVVLALATLLLVTVVVANAAQRQP